MLQCSKCGITTTSAVAFFHLLNDTGTYDWLCKTCVRPAIRSWSLPSDLTGLDDGELRRVMEKVNAMVFNKIFNDRRRLRRVQDAMRSTMNGGEDK